MDKQQTTTSCIFIGLTVITALYMSYKKRQKENKQRSSRRPVVFRPMEKSMPGPRQSVTVRVPATSANMGPG